MKNVTKIVLYGSPNMRVSHTGTNKTVFRFNENGEHSFLKGTFDSKQEKRYIQRFKGVEIPCVLMTVDEYDMADPMGLSDEELHPPEKGYETTFDYSDMGIRDLKGIAKEQGIKGYSNMSKDSLVKLLNEQE